MKKLLVKQFIGLGDLIYTRKIYDFLSKSYDVEWHIIDKYMWFNDYITCNFYSPISKIDDSYKSIYFEVFPCPKSNKLTQLNGVDFIPLSTANIVKRGKIMESKYKMLSLDHSDWQDYFDINRNYSKEEELFSRLKLDKGMKYALVNNMYTPSDHKAKIPVTTDLRIIQLSYIDSFTLFDWSKVIENATEVWTMDTSITLLMEKLNTSNIQKLKMYTRHRTVSECDYLFKKQWEIKCY